MSWSIPETVGTHDAVLALVEKTLNAAMKDKTNAPDEVAAAHAALGAIRSAMQCKVADDYFGPGVTAGWKVSSSAAFSAEGMLLVSIAVDRTPLLLDPR